MNYISIQSNQSGSSGSVKSNSKSTPKEEFIKDILKYFLIEKFSQKNRNVESWCDLFEEECERFELSDPRLLEAFKSCLNPSLADWFVVNQRQLGLSASWKDWKMDLISTFGDQSWKLICLLLLLSILMILALNMQKMLLDLDRQLSELMIDLIVIGLRSASAYSKFLE